MKPIITILFLLPLFLTAQNISVKSFQSIPNDMTARVTAPVTDQNGEKCALIKVRTTQKGFAFEGDMLGISKTLQEVGEIWVYVPAKAKKITLKHSELGILDNYLYPEAIQEATVYILELTTSLDNKPVVDEVLPIKDSILISEIVTEDPKIENKSLPNYTTKAKGYKNAKNTFYIISIAGAGVAGYFYYDANKNYKEYQASENPTEATDLHKLIETLDLIWQSAAGVSAASLVTALIFAKKEKKAKLDVKAALIPVKGGMRLNLAYNF